MLSHAVQEWSGGQALLFGIHTMCLLVTEVCLESFTNKRTLECLSPKCPLRAPKQCYLTALVVLAVPTFSLGSLGG